MRLRPDTDLFYAQTDDLEALAPGQVIEVRPVEIRAFLHAMEVDAWQLSFRTTDTRRFEEPTQAR